MGLLTQHEVETGRLCRSLRLEASNDGKSVILVETDERKAGIQREYRFEITTGDLIALIRAQGIELRAELSGENHVHPADAG
ncbi:hypothetical protein [Paraburkholderia aspalathi]|uniref:hypothetical protein n=1 Tax=Paraburkholderia aspalathi TaxID=1324617 RepID=UPI0038BB9F46